VRYDITAASAAYLNQAAEPTPSSVRYAPASGRGSPRAFGCGNHQSPISAGNLSGRRPRPPRLASWGRRRGTHLSSPTQP